MPLLRARCRRLTVKQPSALPVYGDRSAPAFEAEGVSIRATVQPLSGRTEAALYGERSACMLLLLTASRAELREGTGVCVERTDGQCDYRVAAPPERWKTHVRAVLERV